MNKQGQTRLATYNEIVPLEERRQIEGEIVRKCLTRSDKQCPSSSTGAQGHHRRYASLYFVVGVDDQENELAVYEFIHCVVETLDRHFGNVCELDIMFHLEKATIYSTQMMMNVGHPGDEQIHRPSDRHPVRGGESDVAARNDETSARRGGETWYRRGTRRATVA